MKSKKCLMILFVVALLVSVFSVQTFAATQYTVTIKSNDGTETLWTQTVDSGSEFEILTYGARIVGSAESDYYNYSGSRQFLGFATFANSATVSSFYAVGYTGSVTSNLTLYVLDSERMGAHTIVGDPITGAEIYELWEKDVKLLQAHPDCGNYVIIKYSLTSSKVEPQSLYYYFVIVSSEINTFANYSSGSSAHTSKFKFPEGNKGYYQFGFETLEEAEAYLMGDHDVESFTEIQILPDSDGRAYEADSFVCASGVYTYSPLGSVAQKKTYDKYYLIPWEKIAESSELSFDLEALSLAIGVHTFKVKAKGSGYYDSDFSNELTYAQEQKYSVTTTFTNLTAYNNYDMGGGFSYVFLNKPLSLVLSPTYGYLQPDEIVVTMGGITLTAGTGYYYNAKDGSLVIPKVTGDITITAQGLLKVAAPVIEKEATGAFDFLYPLCLKFNEVNNASGYAAYVDGVEVTASDLKITVTDGVVLMYIPKTAFPASGTYSVYVKALPVEGYMASNPSNTVTVDVTLHMLPAEIVEAPEYITDEYLYAFKVSFFDPQAFDFGVFIDGVRYDDVNVGILDGGEYFGYVQIPAAAFVGGDGSFEIYLETYGPEGSVSSGPSNTLTFEVVKLATPEIRLE